MLQSALEINRAIAVIGLIEESPDTRWIEVLGNTQESPRRLRKVAQKIYRQQW